MAVEIKVAYQKKIGLPEFSSHCLSVEVRTEISDLAQVESEVHKLYGRVQQAVDAHIDPGHISNTGHKAGEPEKPWKCSDKQRDLILRIMDEHDLTKDQMDELAKVRFGHSVVELNKLEASGFIDELFERYRKNSNGSRKQLNRRAA